MTCYEREKKIEEWGMGLWGFSHSSDAVFLGLTMMVGLK